MWSDAEVYENINRLAKLVGYCPLGASPANCEFTALESFISTHIPRYASISTNKTDSTGKTVFYSTTEDVVTEDGDMSPSLLMVNGRWKMHETVFQSSGDPW